VLVGLVAVSMLASACATVESVAERTKGFAFGRAESDSGRLHLQPLAPVRRDIFTRSYQVGEAYDAGVGAPIVSVKNYSVTERVGHATAVRDFAQECKRVLRRESSPCEEGPLSMVRGAMGAVFDVIAAVDLPDGQFFAVRVPTEGKGDTYLFVDPTGRLRQGAYLGWRDVDTHGAALGRVPVQDYQPDVPIDSADPLFSFETTERFVFMGPGYLSFDLVFTGVRESTRGNVYTLLYREFGRDNSQAAAFEQLMQFPVSDRDVRVAGLHIEVESVSADSIRFRVVEDAQPPAPLG